VGLVCVYVCVAEQYVSNEKTFGLGIWNAGSNSHCFVIFEAQGHGSVYL